MPLHKQQKKQLAKSCKRKAGKTSQSKLKRRNIQEDKPMKGDVKHVEQVKAKVPASKVKELEGELTVEQGDASPGPAPSESSEIVQQKQSPMAQVAHSKKEQMKERFLQALEQKFSVSRAAKLAGVPRRTAYRWREGDPVFGEEWDDRREGHLDAIEDAMMEGALRMTQPHHAVLALGMMNAHRSDLYSPKHRVEHTGVGGGPILLAVAAKIKNMDTDTLRSELAKLLGSTLVQPSEEREGE